MGRNSKKETDLFLINKEFLSYNVIFFTTSQYYRDIAHL